MRTHGFACLAAAVVLLAASTSTSAQIFRAYLTVDGSDANPCTLQLPCRLLPAALAAVASGGEIWMLDSANYNTGQVSVNKSVTIVAIPGAFGSLVTLGGHALDINGASINVTLRNLAIGPFTGDAGHVGVLVTSGSSVTLDGCRLRGLATGARVQAASSILTVIDSIFEGNNVGLELQSNTKGFISGSTFVRNATVGVDAFAAQASSVTTVAVSRSTLSANGVGISIESYNTSSVVRGSVADSQIAGNTNKGANVYSAGGGALAGLDISRSTLSGNGTGFLMANVGAVGSISASVLARNDIGFEVDTGGVLETAQNNVIRNNAVNVGSLTTVGTQ